MSDIKMLCENGDVDFGGLVNTIRRKLAAHHELYSMAPKAEYWEELLHSSLADVGIDTDWKADSNHGSGKDMTVVKSKWDNVGERISCKTGQIKDGKLCISGSRLTKHKTLQEKVGFLSDKKEDSYVLLSKEKGCDDNHYKLIMFPTSALDYENAQWTVIGHNKHGNPNYFGEGRGFFAKIQASMSDQLWTYIPDYKNLPGLRAWDIEI